MTTQEPHTINLTLACALAARLCHDLAGVVGTLMGALELAVEDPAMRDEALPMAAEAGAILGQRLRLMRAAWAGEGCEMDSAELRALAAGLPMGRRMQARLDGLLPARQFSAGASRLVLNLLLLAAESLGGDGVFYLDTAHGGRFMLTVQGPRATWPPGLIGQFADVEMARQAAANCDPRYVLGPLSALMAHAAGLKVTPLFSCGDDVPPLLIEIDER